MLPLVAGRLSDDDFAAFCAAADATPVTEDEEPSMRALRAMTSRQRDWASAHEARHRHRRRFAELFRRHDVLLTPVMPTAAYPHDTETDITLRVVDVDGEARSYFEGMYWAGGIGTLLLPVAVPPIGRTPDGLPVGVQVVAPHLHDRTAIAVAGHLEHLVGGFVPPPALAGAPAG